MMKRKQFKVTALLIGLGILLVGVLFYPKLTEKETTKSDSNEKPVTEVEEEKEAKIQAVPTEYDANIVVDVEGKHLKGLLKVKATNYTGKNQEKIYFHLYPNIFRDTASLKGNFWRQIIDENSLPGWIDVIDIQVNGQENKYEIDGTILEIPLENWEMDETINLELSFNIKVPKNNGRLAYDDHAMWLGNWLPIQAAYDDRGWVTDPYYSMGDPFYSEVGKYNVKVNVPASYQIATSGKDELAVTEQDGTLTYTTAIENVRDFTVVVLDENYQKLTEQLGDTTINTWYLNTDSIEAAKQNQEAGVKSLAYFSGNYGKYSYPEYDIVRTGMFTGMEYPGMVFLSGHSFEASNGGDIGTVAHETAHQWWYGIVGNDQVGEPWLDEGLTTYSTTKFLLEVYPEIGQNQIEFRKQFVQGTDRYERNGEFIGSSVDQFTTVGTYSPLVYQKAALMFDELEKVIGEEKINRAFQAYFKKYKYKNATGDDFIAVFSETLGPEATEYFQKWLKGEEPAFKEQ
jgi:hypothetical protein